jgi:colanic acid biosynthesis glycosyl transferase WcaI
LRILLVTQYFWPESFRINDVALGLVSRGHDVTVYTGKPNYPEGRFFPGYGFLGRALEDYGGARVIRVPLVPRGGGGPVRLALNYLSYALIASMLAPLRCRGAYDAILVYEPSPVTVGLPAVVLKRLTGAPLLFWVQDLWPESLSATGAVRSAWILKLVERLVRHIYRRCDRILVQSRAFIEPILRFGVPAGRIHYLPNSAEALYQPVAVAPGAPERDHLPAGFRVMFAGNVGAAQDFETIMAAAERLKAYPDIRWIILGDGRMLAWVEAEVRRRALQSTVRLLGRHPVESMPRFFALADVMLVTLRKEAIFALTIPSRIQSYLACARPIVAALDGEGARVVRESGAGVAVEAGNGAALAEAVLAMSRMAPEARADMARNARIYFDTHFAPSLLLTHLEGWMREAAAETRKQEV